MCLLPTTLLPEQERLLKPMSTGGLLGRLVISFFSGPRLEIFLWRPGGETNMGITLSWPWGEGHSRTVQDSGTVRTLGLSQCQTVTLSHYHALILSHSHTLIMSQCHIVTFIVQINDCPRLSKQSISILTLLNFVEPWQPAVTAVLDHNTRKRLVSPKYQVFSSRNWIHLLSFPKAKHN